MSDALYIATSGLQSVQYQLDNISNDIANINTNNYKRSIVNFEDVMYQNIHGNVPTSPDVALQQTIGMGTAIQSTVKDFSPGTIKVTKDISNVAINGDGFYEVTLEDGSFAYTRSSTITPDKDGYLSTTDGHRLSANIQIPSDATTYGITTDGHVMVQVPNQQQALDLGVIQLSKFMNPSGLQPIANGLYAMTQDSGQPYADNPGNNGMGTLQQGSIETSNVDLVQEMTDLMMAQRIYEMNAQTARIADNMDKMTDDIYQ